MKTPIGAAILLMLCVQTVFAAEPPTKPKEGFGVFLVMFRVSPGPAARAQGPLDVTQYGGVEHERRGDVLVVTLPLQAWARVEAHPQVAYVQRVWMGE
ncbi:MAG TPA: hypothetical protein VEK79_02620, partial [Thermoanaerobaculia bacterium]|nr:hypothetical protein [Thermoanaerobaculia bacterium]